MEKWGASYQPVVSVACASFNHASYLSDAIEGFLAQETDFPFEVIVHDDASTDGSALIIKDFAARFPAIIKPIYQTVNQYSQGQRIIGIIMQSTKGKYIAICEGDDYWGDSSKLQKQFDFLEANPEYSIAFHDAVPIDKNKNPLGIDPGGSRRDLSRPDLVKATPVNTLTVMFRNVFPVFPLEFRLAFYADLFLWSLLGKHGKGKYMANISPAFYRVHENGLHSMTNDKQRTLGTLRTFMALFLYYKREGDPAASTSFGLRVISMVVRELSIRHAATFIRRKLVSLCSFRKGRA